MSLQALPATQTCRNAGLLSEINGRVSLPWKSPSSLRSFNTSPLSNSHSFHPAPTPSAAVTLTTALTACRKVRDARGIIEFSRCNLSVASSY
jgi:hypothetical protein